MKKTLTLFAATASVIFGQQQDEIEKIKCDIEQMRCLLPERGSKLSDCAWGVEFSGDFLYWISNQDEIWFGTLENPPAFLSGGNVFSDVQVLNQKFQFDPGFRVAASYFWTQRDWQTLFSWTEYETSSSAQQSVGVDEVLNSSWGFASRVNFFTVLGIEQTWKLRYDVFDLSLVSHNFNFHNFSFTPTIGARGAFIKQRIDQSLAIADVPMFFVNNSGHMNGNSKFSGFGVLGATRFNYRICESLNLFANFLGSLNYGRAKTVQDYRFFTDNGVPLTAYTPHEKIYRVRGNVEFQAGLSWEQTFADDRTQISLMIGYEQINWFNMNFFKRYFAEEGAAGTLQFAIVDLSGDLTLRGLTTRAGLSF